MRALWTRRFGRGRREGRPEHGTVVLISALLAFEASMYAAVTPVLPHYAHAFGASKPALGVLVAAYAAGMIPGSLAAGWIAHRAGVRRTTLIGLLIFAVSITAFGFGTDIVTLDALRFVQGMACGWVWGGGLTWAIAVAPRERRGEVLGSVIGAAIFGTLLGPILGTLAVAVSTEAVFSFVGAIALVLAFWTMRYPKPTPPEPGTRTPIRAVVGNPRILLGFWLILLEAAAIGATGTLLPLRLSRFGASGVEIGATFLIASLAAAILAGPIGRLVDRRGGGLPLGVGLAMTAVLLAALPIPQSALMLAVLSVIVLGGPLTAYTIPAMSVITESAERQGIALALATMMLNLAWAFGEVVGAPAAANISQATSDAVPLLILAAIMVLTLWPVVKARLTGPPGGPPPRAPEPGSAPEPERERKRSDAERIPVASP